MTSNRCMCLRFCQEAANRRKYEKYRADMQSSLLEKVRTGVKSKKATIEQILVRLKICMQLHFKLDLQQFWFVNDSPNT